MRHVFVLPLVVFLAALSAGCAQLPQEREPAASTPPPAAVQQRGPTGAGLDAKWSSAIVGMPVKSSAGAELGRVQEVIVDGYGRPAFAILS